MLEPFKPVDRDTPYLLPPSLQDWLPQEHLARFSDVRLGGVSLHHGRYPSGP